MNFSLTTTDLLAPGKAHSDVLLLLVQDGFAAANAGKGGLTATVVQALGHGHFSTEAGKTLSLYLPHDSVAPRVIVLGIGAGKPQDLREPLARIVKELVSQELKLAVAFAQDATEEQLTVAMEVIAGAGHVYRDTKPSAKGGVTKVTLGAPNAAAHKSAFARGKALAAGMALTRAWANRPANHATPSLLAGAAQELARQGNDDDKAAPFSCEVLDQNKAEKLGMGAFLAVAKGSAEPPRFIVLEYRGGGKNEAPLVFVGKGVTFDSGGISLKPGPGMDEMKFDMSGAASVLGLFEALRHLRPKINVVGLIPATENMPSGLATKPGDVVTSMSGQTIEILNTDAEGRLILCDALTYAKRFSPRAVVDIATLTGNCVMALGHLRSGLFSGNDVLAQELQRAADQSDDLCWRMPMDDAYGKELKSNFADMANIAGRTAGAISAAKFLEKFTESYPWAHLDIAGTAWNQGTAKGATGRPVPLLLRFVLNMAQERVAFALDTPAAQQADKEPAKPKGAKAGKGRSK